MILKNTSNNLKEMLRRLAQVRLRLKKAKCVFLAPEVTDAQNETVTTEFTDISALHSTQPAGTQAPDGQTAGTQASDGQTAGTQASDGQTAGTQAPDVTSEVPLKGNSSSEMECSGPSEVLTEPSHHTGSEELAGDCGQPGSPEAMQRLGKAITDFGMDLFKEVLRETNKPNVIISPLSIALGLAQLALGSVNQTEKQLQKALHFNSLNCSHHTLSSAINSFTKTILSIASTIYIRKGFHVKPEFITNSEKLYKSRPQLLKGVSAADTEMINTWVERMTAGKIKKFYNEVPSDIVLLLLNAIYFKGLWQIQFDTRMTSDDQFYMEDGSSVPVPMMQHPKYPISGFHDDDLQIEVARMSFKQNVSFIVVKPMLSSKLDCIVSKLEVAEILPRIFRARPMPVKVPKLSIDFDIDLSLALQNLGLGNLFVNPDLSKISSETLLVSAVQHKATMELKEEGVEAAASTGIAVSRSFIQCNINRPFFFIIRDDISGIPLFLGTIKDPRPQSVKDSQDKMVVNLERIRKTVELFPSACVDRKRFYFSLGSPEDLASPALSHVAVCRPAEPETVLALPQKRPETRSARKNIDSGKRREKGCWLQTARSAKVALCSGRDSGFRALSQQQPHRSHTQRIQNTVNDPNYKHISCSDTCFKLHSSGEWTCSDVTTPGNWEAPGSRAVLSWSQSEALHFP
uniref:serpin peptidase inhibitor, clade F (alpha-2 antiplasmin, pigment epithelium derived factor), member 2b n=1 Tax=Pristiophorus japonicus TaxID=55135 RepID=UPI00398E80A6